jgi:hypothetical protein
MCGLAGVLNGLVLAFAIAARRTRGDLPIASSRGAMDLKAPMSIEDFERKVRQILSKDVHDADIILPAYALSSADFR